MKIEVEGGVPRDAAPYRRLGYQYYGIISFPSGLLRENALVLWVEQFCSDRSHMFGINREYSNRTKPIVSFAYDEHTSKPIEDKSLAKEFLEYLELFVLDEPIAKFDIYKELPDGKGVRKGTKLGKHTYVSFKQPRYVMLLTDSAKTFENLVSTAKLFLGED